ncbi:MAG: type II toxin-antitoxin system PemK/MazF family toxin [Actinomycetota bacterium]|nr:type II toxin-antitoxin system PemK/MazF family toxin [Actinomycetota bacterium]
MNRGEIWWAEHPDAGRRPYLILTRQGALPVLSGIVVAQISRTIRGIQTEVGLDADDGMPEPCAASFDNILTIPKWSLVERICQLDLPKLHQVCRALRTATGC